MKFNNELIKFNGKERNLLLKKIMLRFVKRRQAKEMTLGDMHGGPKVNAPGPKT